MPRRAHVQRVAIGCGPRGQFHADDAVRTAAIIDDDLLTQMLAQLDRQYACNNVVAAAGGRTHDESHRLGGECGLRGRDTRNQCQ